MKTSPRFPAGCEICQERRKFSEEEPGAELEAQGIARVWAVTIFFVVGIAHSAGGEVLEPKTSTLIELTDPRRPAAGVPFLIAGGERS
jgi:hypothetical protein